MAKIADGITRCNRCDSNRTHVYETRISRSGSRYRIRHCKECGDEWKTWEIDDNEYKNYLKLKKQIPQLIKTFQEVV